MRWKALFYEQKDHKNNSKNTFGFKSEKTPPPMKCLEAFEKDLYKIVEKIKFQKINCHFQAKLKSDIKVIKSSRKTLISTDKTSNFYKLTYDQYEHLLHSAITKNYK